MQKTPRRHAYDPAAFGNVKVPVLVLIGEGDTLAGKGDALAARIPEAKVVYVPGDHLSAVGPKLAAAAAEFLATVSPVGSSTS